MLPSAGVYYFLWEIDSSVPEGKALRTFGRWEGCPGLIAGQAFPSLAEHHPPLLVYNCISAQLSFPNWSFPDYAAMTWPNLKLSSPHSTTRLSTKSVLTPSLWSHSKPKWDLSTWSWERLNTGKVSAAGTGALSCSSWYLSSFGAPQVTEGSLGQGSSCAAPPVTRACDSGKEQSACPCCPSEEPLLCWWKSGPLAQIF